MKSSEHSKTNSPYVSAFWLGANAAMDDPNQLYKNPYNPRELPVIHLGWKAGWNMTIENRKARSL